MDKRELEIMVPSKDVREYVLKAETGREGDNYRRIAPKMCFSTWESACAYGEKQKCRFQIEKILAADGTADAQENELISYMEFDRDGRAVYLSHTYDNVEEEEFIKAFLPLPNPFERGDVVRRVGSNRPEDYGIVETSQKRHKENYERWKDDPNHFTEFGDDRIRVAFLCNDGTFSHAHIFPMYLERYQPEWNSYNMEGSPLDNLLLSASEMYQGKGSLDELWQCTMEYCRARNRRGKGYAS